MIQVYYASRLFAILFLIPIIFSGCDLREDTSPPSHPDMVYKDITAQSGLNFVHDPGNYGTYYMPESIGSGGAFLDFDNDGDLDIYLVNGAQHGRKKSDDPIPVNKLFRQETDGTFTDATVSSGLGHPGYGMGVAVGDLDNDGDVDIYISNYGPDACFLNNGDGTFSDVSVKAGINNPLWGCSVVFLDYNLDGNLDIFVTNYLEYDVNTTCTDRGGSPDYCGPGGFMGVSDILYRNNGDGYFTDVSVISGIATQAAKGLGVISADINADGFPDIYVANDGDPNHLWINNGNGAFIEQAVLMGAATNEFAQPEAGMGIALGDIDNDMDLDIFIAHMRSETNTLYRNMGPYGLQDNSITSGLASVSIPYTGFGTGFLDYDNDGDLDLAVVNGRVTRGPLLKQHGAPGYWDYYSEPNLLFENNGTGEFDNVSDSETNFCTRIENGRGLAFGDVDNDGDIDLLVMNEGGPARLLRNDSKNKGHWLLIRAIDPDLGRDAIGAKIVITVRNRMLGRLVAPGYSYLSSNDMRAHFGLGESESVDKIDVYWPDRTLEHFPGVAADQLITLRKGEGISPGM